MIAHVIQVGLELSIFLPRTLKCWNYKGAQYIWLQTTMVRRQTGVSEMAQQGKIYQKGLVVRVGWSELI